MRLRLRHPQTICYPNAGVNAMVHFLEETEADTYIALRQLCKHHPPLS